MAAATPKKTKQIAIIGGGASGIFAAIRCAEEARSSQVQVDIRVFESSSHFLRKVKISGGGRCNVTHHLFDCKKFAENYPRGHIELLSPFQQFQARDTVEWFAKKGIKLKHEPDGRMFPVTNRSETIINCFIDESRKLGVQLLPKKMVKSVKRIDSKFSLYINEDESFVADTLLIATGSQSTGYRLAKQLGHKITDLAPSLFSFKIKDQLLNELSGISFKAAKTKLVLSDGKKFKESGPLLITHWGLSGPAVLKISAWAAREMKDAGYKAVLIVNWLGFPNKEQVTELLISIKNSKPNALITNGYPRNLSQRFWQQLVAKCKVPSKKTWADVSKSEIQRLGDSLYASPLAVEGKNRYKDEFVECGGVELKEINLKTMESKICPGLYFAGEIMDIDGITGGFNFQNAWTSGWISGGNLIKNHK